MIERRRDSRFGQHVIAAMRAVLRPGRSVSLVNLSAGGASSRVSAPAAWISVHLQVIAGDRSIGVAARVLRCAVAAIDAEGVQYRGALMFQERCETLWEG